MRLSPRSSFFYISALAALTPMLLAVPTQASSLYSVEELGLLGSGAAISTAFNSSGSVGEVTSSSGNQTPAFFSNGAVTMLPGIGQASGINSSGVIVGTTYSGNNPSVTEWNSGKAQSLGVAGYGTGINDSGQVVGSYQLANGQSHAFEYTNGSLRDLGTLGGNWSSASAVNSAGQVAGNSMTSNWSAAQHAFFWDGSAMHDLGTLGGWNSYANGINNHGEVVGSAQTASGYLNAFAWTAGRGMADLGTLGGSSSAAYGVNDSGTVVGYSFITGNQATHAFIESGGVMLDLNALLPIGSDWTISAAYAIDNAGDILATGIDNGQDYAVELAPQATAAISPRSILATPEPSALALAGLGLIVIARVGRRKSPAASHR